MKNKIFATFIICLFVFSFHNQVLSQSKFQINYFSNFNTNDIDYFSNVKKTTTGYVMAGMVSGISLPIIQSALIKTDTTGNITWAKKIKDGGFLSFKDVHVNDLQATNDGGYIMTGNFGSYAMLLKVSSSGTSLFSKKIGSLPNESGNSVKELSYGGYIVAGSTLAKSMNTDKDSSSIYIFKTNSQGVYQWGRSYTLSSPVFDARDSVCDVVEVSNGFVFAGFNSQLNDTGITKNILIFKTDTSGTLQWMKTYGELGYNEAACSIKLLANGNLLVAGYTDKTSSGINSGDIAVLELDAGGNIAHSYSYDIGATDRAGCIQQSVSGGYAIIGTTSSGLNPRCFLMNLNSAYTPIFAKEYNLVVNGFSPKGEQIPGGGYIIGNVVNNPNYQFHLIKTDASGNSSCSDAGIIPVQHTYSPPVATITPTVYTGGSGTAFTCSLTSQTPVSTVECMYILLAAHAGSDRTICSGTPTTLGGVPTANYGTPSYTYSWTSSPAGFTSSAANPVVAPVVPTTYMVFVTDSAGGTASDSVTVNINPLLTAFTVTGGGNYCAGGNGLVIGLSGSQSGVNYQLQAGGVNSGSLVAGNGTAISFGNQTTAGTYTVVATDMATTCTKTMTGNALVTINSLPNPNLPSGTSTCQGHSVTLIASGGVNYAWSPAAGLSDSTISNPTANPANTTTYHVVVTDNLGCSSSAGIVLTINPVYSINNPQTICNGGSYMMNGHTYTQAGTYHDTLSSKYGCDSIIVTQLSINSLTAIVTSHNVLCYGNSDGSATVAASGGNPFYTYSWNTTPVQTSANATGLIAGTYTVTITDSSGCTHTSQVTIYQPNALIAGISSTDASCNANNDGTATASASGGTPGYTYLWDTSPPQTSAFITGLSIGTDKVTVTDSNSCSDTASITIVMSTTLTISVSASANPVCSGTSIILTASGASGYLWDNSLGTSNPVTVIPVSSATYMVTGTSPGCTGTGSITVDVDSVPPVPAISKIDLVLMSSSATANQWFLNGDSIPGATSQFYTVTQNGFYTVEVTNIDGCSSTSTAFSVTDVGINVYNTADYFNIYPNPAKGLFSVVISGPDCYADIEIYNSTGGLVYSRNAVNAVTTVDLSGSARGLYMVKVISNHQTISTLKIMMQ